MGRKKKDSTQFERVRNVEWNETAAREYIEAEFRGYIPRTQLQNRVNDRITQCEALGHNPFDWVYVEITETVDFKTATYFRWIRKGTAT